MKFLYISILLFTTLFSNAQNFHQGIILDQDVKEPLEFVNVFNSDDNTISNADGQYAFSSSKDSIIFYRVGYDKLKTTFSALRDTIYLNKSVFELNEVVVTNKKNILKKVFDSLNQNYPSTEFKEKFYLRATLKINDTLVRIQDLQGKIKRKRLFYTDGTEPNPKDYEVELSNMRQIGVSTDPNGIYIVFPSFYRFLNLLAPINIEEDYDIEDTILNDGTFTNFTYASDLSEKVKNLSGHFIINNNENAIEEYYLKSEPKNPTYQKNKNFRYRTTFYDVSVFFTKHPKVNKYFISSAKFNATIEGTNVNKTFNSKYDMSFILTTSENFGNFPFKKNIKSTKDIFKLKHPYKADFWKTQNQLILTNEMQEFITRMGSENKEFKIRTNID